MRVLVTIVCALGLSMGVTACKKKDDDNKGAAGKLVDTVKDKVTGDKPSADDCKKAMRNSIKIKALSAPDSPFGKLSAEDQEKNLDESIAGMGDQYEEAIEQCQQMPSKVVSCMADAKNMDDYGKCKTL